MTGRSVPASAATLRAYRADWAHYASWCAASHLVPAPASPETVEAYLASLAASHAPSTIRRRFAAIAKMHQFNDLAWDGDHAAIRKTLPRVRVPSASAATLTPSLLRRLLETCDSSARGRRDRALLLFAFTGRLRRADLVGLQVEDVAEAAGGLTLRIGGAGEGKGRAVLLPRGSEAGTCPVAAFRAWQEMARRRAGPLFRPVSRGGTIGAHALNPDAVRRILARRVGLAGIADEVPGRLSPDVLRRRERRRKRKPGAA